MSYTALILAVAVLIQQLYIRKLKKEIRKRDEKAEDEYYLSYIDKYRK